MARWEGIIPGRSTKDTRNSIRGGNRRRVREDGEGVEEKKYLPETRVKSCPLMIMYIIISIA